MRHAPRRATASDDRKRSGPSRSSAVPCSVRVCRSRAPVAARWSPACSARIRRLLEGTCSRDRCRCRARRAAPHRILVAGRALRTHPGGGPCRGWSSWTTVSRSAERSAEPDGRAPGRAPPLSLPTRRSTPALPARSAHPISGATGYCSDRSSDRPSTCQPRAAPKVRRRPLCALRRAAAEHGWRAAAVSTTRAGARTVVMLPKGVQRHAESACALDRAGLGYLRHGRSGEPAGGRAHPTLLGR
jgi:hypothetical protein